MGLQYGNLLEASELVVPGERSSFERILNTLDPIPKRCCTVTISLVQGAIVRYVRLRCALIPGRVRAANPWIPQGRSSSALCRLDWSSTVGSRPYSRRSRNLPRSHAVPWLLPYHAGPGRQRARRRSVVTGHAENKSRRLEVGSNLATLQDLDNRYQSFNSGNL